MMKIFFESALILILATTLFACGSSSTSESTPPDVEIPEVPETPETPEDGELEFTSMRSHWSSYYVGDASLPFDDQLVAATDTMNTNTVAWLASYQANDSDGLWNTNGFELDSIDTLDTNLYSTYSRLFTMAKVYQLPTASLYQDAELLAMLIESLDFLNSQFYKEGVLETGNWWHWELGIARTANNTLILLYDVVPQALITNYIAATKYFVPRPTHLSDGEGAPDSPATFESTGANRVDNVQVVLTRSFLANDDVEFTDAVEALESVITTVDSGDGFYQDGSFIQHDSLAYTGTYGQVLLEGIGKIAGVVSDPDLQESIESIYSIIFDSFYPLMIDGRMMDMVSGRAVSRTSGQNHYIGHSVLSAMLFYVESAPADEAAQLKSIIKTQIENDEYRDFFASPNYFRNQQLAQQIVADDSITTIADRSEHRQFNSMGRVVHHRPTWTFGVATHSNLVGNYECINGENQKGWHTGDGMTYLYNQQDDHYSDYWAIVDASKLPGTTFFSDPAECEGQFRADGYLKDAIEWSGGSSIGNYGTVGFDFINWDDTVSAKKSWFMFDDEIIALGSDINNSVAFTAIENRKIEDDATISINGNLLTAGSSFSGVLQQLDIEVEGQANNLSYLLITPQNAEITNTENSGNYSDIGNNSKAVSASFISAVLDHNSSDGYQYMIFPNATAQTVTDAATIPPVTILENSNIAHALTHTSLKLAAFNFWQAGTVNGIDIDGLDSITTSTPLSMMISFETYASDKIFKMAISNPTRGVQPLSVDIGKNYTIMNDLENRISKTGSTSFSVNIDGLEGNTYQFELHEESE